MARILIVGSGVVGQATGKGFAKKGHSVSYVDINPETIAKLQDEGLDAMTAADVDWNAVDAVMLAVPTPSVDGQIVLDYIEAAALDVGRGLAKSDHFVAVVVRSTVPPTTTEDRIAPILARASGKQIGVDFGVAMNPEFLRQVTSEQDFARPWITVLGTSDRRTAEVLDALYRPFGALIVNCTSVGLRTDDHPFKSLPLDADTLDVGSCVVDMVYKPGGTALLAEARRRGATVVTGMEILIAQGAASFERWTGRTASREAMRGAVPEIA